MDRAPDKSIAVVASIAGSLINFRGHLLAALVSQGFKVTAFAPAETGMAERLQQIGVTFREIPLKRNGLDPLSDIRLLLRLHREFRELRPAIVLSYTIKPVVYGSIAARLARVPVIVAMITGLGYAFTGDGWRRRWLRALVTGMYRTSLRKVHCVFFQNRDDARTFIELGIIPEGGRVEHIHGSGVDIEHFAVARLPREPSFLMISRLLRDKGVLEFVAAARLLRKVHPEVPCRLVGPLDSNPSAIDADQVRKWEEEGIVEYLGEMSDVRPALARSTVYVLPSYREGMPRTVLEAMSMGRATITTDAPGCRDAVTDGENGFIVPVADSNALFTAMARCVEDPDLVTRMGHSARERAVGAFDVRKVNARILQVIQQLLAGAANGRQ